MKVRSSDTFYKEVRIVLAEIRTKSQITIPASIVKQLNLKQGDKIDIEIEDGKIILKPIITIPKDQAYFWEESWQNEEKKVNDDVKQGKIYTTDNKEKLFEDLGL